jgi:hypothetical protein
MIYLAVLVKVDNRLSQYKLETALVNHVSPSTRSASNHSQEGRAEVSSTKCLEHDQPAPLSPSSSKSLKVKASHGLRSQAGLTTGMPSHNGSQSKVEKLSLKGVAVLASLKLTEAFQLLGRFCEITDHLVRMLLI